VSSRQDRDVSTPAQERADPATERDDPSTERDDPSTERHVGTNLEGQEREPRLLGRRGMVLAVVIVPVIGFALLLATGLARDPRELPSDLIGKRAPEFSLPRLGAPGRVELASLRGQVVVLNFWASWCLACRDEHPDLLAAWERYRERGVVLVGIDFEDTEEAALAYTREMGGDWPLASDPDSRAAIAYGVFGVPETFVISPNGTVTAKNVGAVTYGWLTREIEAALQMDAA
jgi:cytochrome c biogenesis protein CcmG, thiol:disulfide interchange protein DsbE